MDAKETQDAIRRLRHGYGNWFDWEKVEEHIRILTEELARKEQTIAQLRAEVDAHDRALQARDAEIASLKRETQAPPGWHKLFVATPTLPVEISVNGVPIPLHNGASTEEMTR